MNCSGDSWASMWRNKWRKSDGKSEGLKVGLIEGVTLVRFDITILGLADFSKLGEDIGLTWIEG